MIVRALALLPLLCGGAAFAQEAAPPVAPEIGPPWDAIDVQVVERRYKVEAVRFKARDESGIDWLGSDEVRVGTADAKGFTGSDEIGDIDSGDTHEFDPAVSCIIAVRPGVVTLGKDSVCEDAGVPGPFSFRVELWEQDTYFDPFGFSLCVPGQPESGMHTFAECPNDDRGDDFLGGMELFFPVPDLEATLPAVGDSFTETVALSPCEHGFCAGWLLPDYSFTYRTTRMPDVGTDFRTELSAAMTRTDITRADEAVAAGLRLLAATPPRPAEKETPPVTTAEGG